MSWFTHRGRAVVGLNRPESPRRPTWRALKTQGRNMVRRLTWRQAARLALTVSVATTLVLVTLSHLRSVKRAVQIGQVQQRPFAEQFDHEALRILPMSSRAFGSATDRVFEEGCRDVLAEARQDRANAAFVVLARNSELEGVVHSMDSLERHFNQWFNYPWVFLNDEEFTQEFKETARRHGSGRVDFAVVPKVDWELPEESSDANLFAEAIEEQGDRGIMYGSMASYHRMCRFYSGHFFDVPQVRKLDWYWRVEPDVDFYCDITYDPFLEMARNGKKYGFTVLIKELADTVPSLFRSTLAFAGNKRRPSAWDLVANDYNYGVGRSAEYYRGVRSKPEFWRRMEERTRLLSAQRWAKGKGVTAKMSEEEVISNLGEDKAPELSPFDRFNGLDYNLCHFWSNFEIARVDLFRSAEYQAYLAHLEKGGGFYLERWGDAPIHSLALGLMLNQSQIHYFRDIGYKHSTLGHCPANSPHQLPYKASGNYLKQLSRSEERYWRNYDSPKKGTGCRCRCPRGHREIEDSGGSCIWRWAMLGADEYVRKGKVDLARAEKKAVESYEKYVLEHPGHGDRWRLTKGEVAEFE